MSDSGHQLPQRSHLFVLDQLGLGFLQLPVRLLQIVIGLNQLFGHGGARLGHLAPARAIERSSNSLALSSSTMRAFSS